MTEDMQKLTLFYDGSCPLCQAEIHFLSGRNEAGLIDFVDIHSKSYDPLAIGISCEQALAAMYGQFSDGTLINGVPVFSEAYRRARLPFLAWIFSRNTLQPMLKIGYRLFAKNRHLISRLLGPSALWLVSSKSSTDLQ